MNALLVVLCFVFVFSQHALSKWILNSIMATATDLLFLTLCRVPPHQEKIKFPDISLTTKQFQWAWLWQPLTRDYSFHWSAFTVHVVANLKQSEKEISWLDPKSPDFPLTLKKKTRFSLTVRTLFMSLGKMSIDVITQSLS